MRYGTLPIVRHVGGLCDTIIDATDWTLEAGSATGFAFRELSAPAMLDCLDRALALYTQQGRWRRMQQRAMSREFGWDVSARRYAALYRKVAPQVAQIEIGHSVANVISLGASKDLLSPPRIGAPIPKLPNHTS